MKTFTCPRCDSSQVTKVADSPVEGVFEVYRCEACNYVWRSTEDLSGITKRIDHWRETVNTSMLEY
ncbi:non-oxidative hydroxyarylic acid decarboxylases subunit D [Chloroflexota bacterium]